MKISKLVFAAATLSAVVILMTACFAQSQEVPRMSKEEVSKMLGNTDAIIIDVRQQSDWNNSKEKIKGAVREDPAEVATLMDKYPKDKTLIFYCA